MGCPELIKRVHPELVERVTLSDCSSPSFVIPGLPRNPVFISLKDQKITLLEQRVTNLEQIAGHVRKRPCNHKV
jgi:hypothetical protein